MSDGNQGRDEGDLPPPPPPPSTPPPPPATPAGWQAGPGPDQPVTVPGGHPLAEPWSRIGARVIDGLILLAVSFVLAAALIDFDDVGTGVNVGFTFVSVVVGVAYEVGFVGSLGGTPGKLLLGLRVITQEDGTTPPGWDKAGLRYLPSLAGLVPVLGGIISLAIAVVSLVWLFTDDRRRTVYDRVATTYVVKV